MARDLRPCLWFAGEALEALAPTFLMEILPGASVEVLMARFAAPTAL